ncbi:branched-chain amino acid ABC transporter permease [Acidothermaceae bacterium B102]|nr:branched-chain amino acid ABC transporter permease [Acidothermaceae bacterium B102]
MLLQAVVTGLSVGAIYGLVAMGFAVVFYVTRVINFATGQLLMVAVMIIAGLAQSGLSPWLGIPLGLLASALGAVVIYFVAVRPVLYFDRLSLAWLVSTLGMAIILASTAALIWGTSSLAFPTLLNGKDVQFLGAALSWQQILSVIVAVVLTIAIEAFRTRTLVGKLGMAISEDSDTASAMGVNVTRYAVCAFALGGLLAGIAGVLVGPISFANPYLGDTYGIYGFVALMIGGIERPAASMGGGLILGVLVSIASTYINPLAADWFPFVVVIAVLLVTPNGIFRSGALLKRLLSTRPMAPAAQGS